MKDFKIHRLRMCDQPEERVAGLMAARENDQSKAAKLRDAEGALQAAMREELR